MDYHLLLEEKFWLVGPPAVTMPIALEVMQADLRTLEQWLRQQPWFVYSEDLPIIRRFWRIIFDRRLDVNPQFVIPDLRSIREAIAQGLGFRFYPTIFVLNGLLVSD